MKGSSRLGSLIAIMLIFSMLCTLFSGCDFSSTADGELQLCETVVSGLQTGDDWVELHYTGSSTLYLDGYCLLVDEDSYALDGLAIQGGGYVVLRADSLGFALSTAGYRLVLQKDGENIDNATIPALIAELSYARCNGEWRFLTTPTPGAAQQGGYTSMDEALNKTDCPLVINEVIPSRMKVNGCTGTFVELYNQSNSDVLLSDYTLTDSLSDQNKYRFASVTLKAGEYYLLPFQNAAPQPVQYATFNIAKSTALHLCSNDRVVSSLLWSPMLPPGFSAGRRNGRTVYYTQPTPGTENNEATEDYTMQEGKSDIVINEILLHNTLSAAPLSGGRCAWAELYNATDSDLSLAGYFLSNDATQPYKWALPQITLKAGGYLLVFFTGDFAIGTCLEAPFKLSEGQTLILSCPASQTKQTEALSTAPENISFAQGSYNASPTPGKKNTAGTDTPPSFLPSGLYISEVCSVQAARSQGNDWIELYNASSSTINLSGLYLSDSKNQLKRYALEGSIPAGGYKVIGKSKEVLSIAAKGETLYLSSDAFVLDVFKTPRLLPQYTAGRNFKEGAAILLMSPTDGRQNSTDTLQGYCAVPVFAKRGGYYENGTRLSITCSDPQAKIYYTLNGSAPSENATEYQGEITISATTVVRAICIRSGYADSPETVGTFRTGKDNHTLPVVCLSIDSEDLNYIYGSESRLDKRERAGYAEYYMADGKQAAVFPTGLSIGGAGTRQYAQRTFNLNLRGAYGQSEVTFPFFSGLKINTFSSLTLRNSGQDWSVTRLRDAYVSMAVNGMHINNAQSSFAVVYLNGKYNGLYEFKENQNEDYFAAHTGCDRDSVQLVRANTYVYNKQGNNKDIKALLKFATENNFSDNTLYERYCTWVDEDYYTDYLIAQAFFVCSDYYNQKSAQAMDGTFKWQPVFFDLDYTIGTNYKRHILHSFLQKDGLYTVNGYKVETALFGAFYENAGWRDKFVNRYSELLKTVLSTERLLALYDEMVAQVTPEMQRTIDKWHQPSSMQQWSENVAAIRFSLANRRPYAISEIRSLFSLTDQQMQELFPNT